MVDWSKKFSLATGVNETSIVDMTSKLATMGSAFLKAAGPNAAKALEKLTGGLQDMSAATGKSASMLMRSLGPAILNTPEKATGLLIKFGVLTDKQAGKVKSLVKQGHAQAATQLEINAIQQKFAGTAAATATPMEKLANLWNQVQLAAGKALVPILGDLMAMVGWLEKNADLVKTVGVVVAAVAVPFLAYAAAMKIAAAAQLVFNTIMEANPIALVAIAIGVLAIVVIRNWTKIKAFTMATWDFIRRHITVILVALMGPVGLLVAYIIHHWQGFKVAVMAVFHAVSAEFKLEFNVIKTVFNAVKGALITGWHAIGAVGSAIWGPNYNAAKTVFNAIARAWNDTIAKIGIHFHHFGVNIDLQVPQIPTLREGGFVAHTGLAIVHEGEVFSGVGRGFGVTVNVYGSVMTEHDLAQSIQKALLRDKRRSGALGLA